MSSYTDLIRDFADRTRKNLLVIEALAKTHVGEKPHEGVFEVTQLVNSLLGLLVFPQQEWFKHLPETPLSQWHDSTWKNLNITVWDRKHKKGPLKGQFKEKTFKEVAICLRNSISHCNVEFTADRLDELCEVRLSNVPDAENNPTYIDFEVRLDVATLRALALTFMDQLTQPVVPQPAHP